MIYSEHGAHFPMCDTCGEELQNYDDFYDAVDAKKAAGWKSVKEKWGWHDYCPTCYEASLWEED